MSAMAWPLFWQLVVLMVLASFLAVLVVGAIRAPKDRERR